ncbi:hypothetical protein [Bacillus methanolicus]|uniref:hypothetical protein n=1 Tax=Bacillus methanolicus TaxID=1471 RepID=UPI0020104BF4|nr:hypothetical protein [Bacillus methanolicus]
MSVSYQDALAYYGIDGAHPGGIALTKKFLMQGVEPVKQHLIWQKLFHARYTP